MSKNLIEAEKAANVAKVLAALEIARAIGDTIRELKSVPSGDLYARVMSYLSLEQYTQIINLLKYSGLVEERNHELFWKEVK